MKTNILLLLSAVLLFLHGGCQTENKLEMNKESVKELDLDRYLGTWYEIARFDHNFEKGLTGVTATYSLKNDGNIRVINQGYKNVLDGKLSIAEGKAKLTSKPGKLKVSFFWIFYADYFVLELDKEYQWALIGSSSAKYLWILSRTPKLEDNVKEMILRKAEERSYDITKLIWVTQKTI
jgi:lipocalin